MPNHDLLIAANTIWVVQNGGTHGSPIGPLLLRCGNTAAARLRSGEARLRTIVPTHGASE